MHDDIIIPSAEEVKRGVTPKLSISQRLFVYQVVLALQNTYDPSYREISSCNRTSKFFINLHERLTNLGYDVRVLTDDICFIRVFLENEKVVVCFSDEFI
jgi:hypothetical protein